MKEGLDWIARGIANAVTDIRQKVVEEPWFGRAVTPDATAEVPGTRPSVDDWWRNGGIVERRDAAETTHQESPADDAMTHTHQHKL